MRNLLKPLAKITLPHDNAQDEKNCVSPFGYVLWNMGIIPVGPLPPRKVASPNRADYCSIAILHLFQKNLKLGRLPQKIAVGQLWAKEMG